MSEAVLLVPHMSSCNGQEQMYLSCILKLDVHLQANVLYRRHCTHFAFLESILQISSKFDDDDDEEEGNSE